MNEEGLLSKLETKKGLLVLVDNGSQSVINVNEINVKNDEVEIYYSRIYMKEKNNNVHKSEGVGFVVFPINKLGELGFYFGKQALSYLRINNLFDGV